MSVAYLSMPYMNQIKVKCHCGRFMSPNGSLGRGGFRCGCGRDPVWAVGQPNSVRCCTYGTCRTLATTKEPLRFCPEHEVRAAVLLAHTAGAEKLRELEEGLASSPTTLARRYGYKMSLPPTGGAHVPLVYFARRERLIKIGRSVVVRKRMSQLATSVLATEPGDIVREKQLHNQFAHLRAFGREWFHPGPELIAYINDLRVSEGRAVLTR
jgi:hypothetical protein